MTDKKISELTAITGSNTAATDVFVVVDTSTGQTKKITREELNNAIERDVLDSIDIDTINGDFTVNGNINLGDNNKAIFGAGSDLEIYHDGSNSIVKDAGTGSLELQGSSWVILKGATSGNWGLASLDGAQTNLYHNGSLKLGTTATGIDVTGTVTAEGLTISDDYPQIIFTDTNNNPDWTLIGANGRIGFYDATNAVEVATINSTGIDVTGTVTADNYLYLGSPTGSAFEARSEDSYVTLSAQARTLNYLGTRHIFLGSDFSERLRITSAGLVGIGTSLPAAKIDSQEAYDTVSNILTNGTYAAKFGGNTAVGAAGRAQGIMISGRSGNTRGAAIIAENQGSGNGHDLLFATSADASVPAERLRITDAGLVGIGTSLPDTLLEIASSAPKLYITNTSYTINNTDEYGSLDFVSEDGSFTKKPVARIQAVNTGGAGSYSALAFHTSFGTGAANTIERMRLDSSGNLLVGTTDTTIFNDNADEYGFMVEPTGQMQLSANNATMMYLNRQNGDGTIVDFRKDGTTVGVIGTQNWGIGTSSPSHPLHVYNSSAGTIAEFRSSDGTNNPRFSIYGDSSGTHLHHTWSSGAGNLIFEVGGSAGSNEKMRIDSSGRLGLGTDSPSAKLDLVLPSPAATASSGGLEITEGTKTFAISTTGSSYNYAGVGANELWYYGNSNFGALTFGSDGAVPVKFISNGSEHMRVTSAGLVGIGTSLPSKTVEVTSDSLSALKINGYSSSSGLPLYTYNDTAGAGFCTGDADSQSQGYANLMYLRDTDNSFSVYLGQAGAATHRMKLEADGDLHVDGNVVAYSTTVSDIRLKKDVAPIENAVTKVQQLNGCTFTYLKDDRKSAGLIAQDVEKVLPSAVIEDEAVFHGEEGETYKTVQYDQVIGLLVEAVKELKAEIEELKDASSK